jgi:hypothetical protein
MAAPFDIPDLLPEYMLYDFATAYETQIEADMRLNRPFDVGMLVAVHSFYDTNLRIGTGIVRKVEYGEAFGQWLCDVETAHCMMYCIAASRLKRQVFTNVKALLRQRVIQGGVLC